MASRMFVMPLTIAIKKPAIADITASKQPPVRGAIVQLQVSDAPSLPAVRTNCTDNVPHVVAGFSDSVEQQKRALVV